MSATKKVECTVNATLTTPCIGEHVADNAQQAVLQLEGLQQTNPPVLSLPLTWLFAPHSAWLPPHWCCVRALVRGDHSCLVYRLFRAVGGRMEAKDQPHVLRAPAHVTNVEDICKPARSFFVRTHLSSSSSKSAGGHWRAIRLRVPVEALGPTNEKGLHCVCSSRPLSFPTRALGDCVTTRPQEPLLRAHR